MVVVAVDLGGTNLRAGLVSTSGVFLDSYEIKNYDQTSNESILRALNRAIRAAAKDRAIDGIGIGVPGLVDAETGVVKDLANVPVWRNVSVRDRLAEEFGLDPKRVVVNNDANCFALGEYRFGDHGLASGNRDLVGMIIGTGLGAGLVIDGKLHSGRNTSAGEIGEIPYGATTLEAVVSGTGFQQMFGISAKEAARRIQDENNALMRTAFTHYGKHVGVALAIVAYVYNPEVIVVGGGVAKA
jgi:glucokinase